MRHCGVIYRHPDQSEQVPAMVERYRASSNLPAAKSTVMKTGAAVNLPFPYKSLPRHTMC